MSTPTLAEFTVHRPRPGMAASPDRSRAGADPLAQGLLGLLFLGLVALLSLPAARASSVGFGWTGFWLLATPASAWLALWLRRLATAPRAPQSAPAATRRRVVPGAVRRRGAPIRRARRRADAA